MAIARQSRIQARLRQIESKLPQIRDRAYEEFVKVTPIDTGNARNSTRKITEGIFADYPYAVRLEKEAWSRQAPKGMSEPTIAAIRAFVRTI
jgi:hypothetical protein